jgi:hypothetical protein
MSSTKFPKQILDHLKEISAKHPINLVFTPKQLVDKNAANPLFIFQPNCFPSDAIHKSTLSVYVYRTKSREGIKQRDQAVVESGSNSCELPSDQRNRSLAAIYPIFSDVSKITEKTLYTDLES